MHYVYALKSEANKWLYIGYTTNVTRRLKEHNDGESEYTSHRGPWRLVYYEAYRSQIDAIRREKMLKKHGNSIGVLKKRISESIDL